ncbi:MAG TPA: MarR family transcriptional regulator [Candidatus Sulfotelmatobacter sp.]|nr:MarR family transcriptional regulator [Candidatus Sulfotelmatobacter sp.]
MSEPVQLGRLAPVVGYHLRRAQLRAYDDFPAEATRKGITPPHLAVLLLVEANPGIKQTTLAKVLSLDRSTMVRMVDRLEEAKLIERGSSRADRRVAPPVLTAKGRAYVDAMLPKVLASEEALLAPLSTAERATLLRLLGKLTSPANIVAGRNNSR